jgi:transporter family-2 protein
MKPLAFALPLALMGAAVGLSVSVQAGINAQLRTFLGSPVQAALVSFLTGTVALAAVALVERSPVPPGLAAAPWWIWLGGLLGAFNIAASVFLAPRLGALVLAMVIISGQLIASMLLDHFGLLGYRRVPVEPGRVAGAVLLVVGVFLAARR